jgi:AraC family transcriptional regulator
MGEDPRGGGLEPAASTRIQSPTDRRLVVPCLGVVRRGCLEPFVDARPALSSAHARWSGIALEKYSTPAISIPRHEHPELFLHMVVSGTAKYEVNTSGRSFRYASRPGTILLLPRGTEDEQHWAGPIDHLGVAVHPRFIAKSLEETAHETEVEMTEHWNLVDGHISALLNEMADDLDDQSPAGSIYGDTLATALSVYLLKRYAVRRRAPVAYRGGLPGYRLKRVLDYIASNLDKNIRLSELAAIAGMSPHYFAELFKQSTGRSPHNYILSQRIECTKQGLRNPRRSILNVALDAGFENPSHFSRVFRKVEGTSPTRFRADYAPRSGLIQAA